MGRPSGYSAKIADEICRRLANGDALLTVCAAADMPARDTVYRWLDQHREFQDKYARATTIRTEKMADELLAIADDGTNDYKPSGQDGEMAFDGEHVQRSKLRVETRKWLLSKMIPKVYGDKQEITGANGTPLAVRILRLSDA